MPKVYQDVGCVDKTLSLYDLEGPLDLVIASLQGVLNDHEGQGHTHVKLDMQYDSFYGDSAAEVVLHYTRPETDRERDKRLSKATKHRLALAKAREEKENKDKATYLKLKEKFGG